MGFSLALFYGFSVPGDEEFAMQARRLLNSWIQIEKIERRLLEKNTEDQRSIDIVGGIDELVTEIRAMGTDAGKG